MPLQDPTTIKISYSISIKKESRVVKTTFSDIKEMLDKVKLIHKTVDIVTKTISLSYQEVDPAVIQPCMEAIIQELWLLQTTTQMRIKHTTIQTLVQETLSRLKTVSTYHLT
jgi:hypothetical protein